MSPSRCIQYSKVHVCFENTRFLVHKYIFWTLKNYVILHLNKSTTGVAFNVSRLGYTEARELFKMKALAAVRTRKTTWAQLVRDSFGQSRDPKWLRQSGITLLCKLNMLQRDSACKTLYITCTTYRKKIKNKNTCTWHEHCR